MARVFLVDTNNSSEMGPLAKPLIQESQHSELSRQDAIQSALVISTHDEVG